MEAMGHEEETGGLVRQDADPDAGQPEPEHEDAENCDQCTNSCHADHGADQGVAHIAGGTKTAGEDHLRNLKQDDDRDPPGNHHAHLDGVPLVKVQPEIPFAAEREGRGQNQGDAKADSLTDAAVGLGFLFPGGAQGLTCQGDGGYLHAVGKGKAQAQQVHSDVVHGKFICSQARSDQGGGDKANPHGDVFKGGGAGQTPDGGDAGAPELQTEADQAGELDVTVFADQRKQCHASRYHGSQHGGNGGAAHAPGRKAEMPFNQEVIEDDVDDAAGQIGGHGKPGISAAPLRRIDNHGNDVEEETAHDDLKILDRRLVGIGVASGKRHDLRGKCDEEDGDQHAKEQRQQQGSPYNFMRTLLILFAFAPGDQGGNRHVDPDKQGQPDKLRLCRQPGGGYRIAAQLGYHHGIDHSGKRHEKAFHHRRPGDGQRFADHLPFIVFHLFPSPIQTKSMGRIAFKEGIVNPFWMTLFLDLYARIGCRKSP